MVHRSLACLFGVVTAALAPALAWGLDEGGGGNPEPENRDKTVASPPLHRSPQGVKAQSKASPTTASCMNANTQCLLACSGTEESAELTCSNRCRANLRSCTARIRKAPAAGGGRS